LSLSVLCVPQWQGSGVPDAPRLADGARATAALLSDAIRADAEIVAGGSPRRDGVNNLDALVANLARTREALRTLPAGPLLVTGGDCGMELAPIGAALARHGEALTVLWFDAHADLNTPESSPSGNFHGMVLRTLLGEGPSDLVPERPLRPSQVILAGVRVFDPPEADYVRRAGLRLVPVSALHTLAGLTGPLYVHIDIDVLDPAYVHGLTYKEPEGVSADALVELVRSFNGVVGASLVERAHRAEIGTADDPLLERLIDAYTAAARQH
jgi:arginase